MRNRTRLTLIAALAVLPASVPAAASAASSNVIVGDDFFQPSVVRVNPGDTVTWMWQGSNQHTVTTYPGQTENFSSGTQTGPSATFSRTFNRRGRFRYFCEVHPFTMRGAVEVGAPPFPDTTVPVITRARVMGSPGRARFVFRLSEKALVTIRLRGPSPKRYRKRLGKGRHKVTIRGLRAGRYRATVDAKDAARNRAPTAKGRFRVPR